MTTMASGYAAKYGILETAMRIVDQHGPTFGERRAVEYAWGCSTGSERRDFWMRVAQVIADFRESLPENEKV